MVMYYEPIHNFNNCSRCSIVLCMSFNFKIIIIIVIIVIIIVIKKINIFVILKCVSHERCEDQHKKWLWIFKVTKYMLPYILHCWGSYFVYLYGRGCKREKTFLCSWMGWYWALFCNIFGILALSVIIKYFITLNQHSLFCSIWLSFWWHWPLLATCTCPQWDLR